MENIYIEERLVKNCKLEDYEYLMTFQEEKHIAEFCKEKHCKYSYDDIGDVHLEYGGNDGGSFDLLQNKYLYETVKSKLKNEGEKERGYLKINLVINEELMENFEELMEFDFRWPLYSYEVSKMDDGKYELTIKKNCYYKNYKKVFIGESDIASLIFRSADRLLSIDFGEDGDYRAYIVDEDAEIGSHYEYTDTFCEWLKIYDDLGLRAKFTADQIKVYQAGSFGIIIQLINSR